ncbi:YlcI/YnfO family protein [Candidatus Pantoea multigeneris]|uniref:DUF3950 domain-containing protein n=1 Tax=Candidatus Pantoea multigeneris TaxID=2608357 RepID=A0ABX0R449_9GAMM|nr:DUF3950 domain-containing protein [Pantoea multigeneris]
MDKMSTSKTRRRHIRFPHSLLEGIEASLARECSQNFSAWVVEACRLRIKSESAVNKALKSGRSSCLRITQATKI